MWGITEAQKRIKIRGHKLNIFFYFDTKWKKLEKQKQKREPPLTKIDLPSCIFFFGKMKFRGNQN